MHAGQLRHTITIQRRTLTPDEYRQPIETWSDLGSTVAAIEPLSGREWFASMQTQAELTHKVTCRYHAGWFTEGPVWISPGQLEEMGTKTAIDSPILRIVYGSRVFNVLSIVDLEEKHRWLEFRCKEAVA